jgi:RimJ/RimL family protein N-acetyltransferase
MDAMQETTGCRRGLVSVGRLRPGDRAAVHEVFDAMSEQSRTLRFHGAKPRLLDREVDQLVDVGRCGREAVAAIDLVTGKVVGIARFVRDGQGARTAEVAFEVVDGCQSSGLGRRLLDELRSLAMHEGIRRFRASVVVGNEPALALLRRTGQVVQSGLVDGAYELVVELDAVQRAA